MECHGKLENFHQALNVCWVWDGGHIWWTFNSGFECFSWSSKITVRGFPQKGWYRILHMYHWKPLKHGTIMNLLSSKHVQWAVGICICVYIYIYICTGCFWIITQCKRDTLSMRPNTHINSSRNTLALPKPWPFDESCWQIPLELAELNSQEGLNELLEKVWNLGAQHSCAMFRFSNSGTRVTKQLWDSYGVEGVERMSWCHA